MLYSQFNTAAQTAFRFVCLALLACKTIPAAYGQPDAARPNILWIVANDISTDLGCYANPLVRTPNLDKLAAGGIAYKNMITAGAVCSPSRSAFITGMHAISINCHNQFPNKKTVLPASIIPLPELMKAQGYYVANSGGVDMKGPYYTGYNFEHDPAKMYDGFHWSGRKKGQPFFAQVHLKFTHRPFARDPLHPIDPDKINLPPFYPNHPMARKDWAMYLETMQLLDQEIGSILDQLKKDGLEQNTVIFFFGDHGHPHVLGKQFLYEGGVNAPLIVSGPGINPAREVSDRLISNIDIAAATLKLAGAPIPSFMQGRDFLAKDAIPNRYVYAARDRCDETLDRIRMVRTKDMKLIRNYYPDRPYTQFNAYKKTDYPILTLMQVMYQRGELTARQARFMADKRPEFELYDLRKDPFELENLADQQAYREQFRELREALDKWVAEADKGPHPEAEEEIAFAREKMKKAYETKMKSRGLPADVSDTRYLEFWESEFTRWFPEKER